MITMFSQISRAAGTATSNFKRRWYDPQMNVPGVAEFYLIASVAKWLPIF